MEIRLIKKAFTPGEIWPAGQMSRLPAQAAEIAHRKQGEKLLIMCN